jgi:molybdopterin-guanine dinucleotide biosynthesis protein A
MIECSAIILAGGRSRRMGRPKAALPFGGGTILDRIIAELEPRFAELVVVAAPLDAGADAAAIPLRPDGRVIVLRDPSPFAGPAPALVRGLRAMRYPTAFVCSCDLPLLRGDLAQTLCSLMDGFDAAIPMIEGIEQPLCAAYRHGAADLIEAAMANGESRPTTITARLKVRWVRAAELTAVDRDLRSFLNVNTPADYAEALRRSNNQ